MNAPFLPRTIPVAAITRYGLVGYWCMNQIETGSRPIVRNLASGQPVSYNLHSGPRRLFSNTLYYTPYTGGGATYTITDDAAADSDGVSGEASTYVTSTSAFLQLTGGGESYPAGDYTIAMSGKSNSGSDQSFRFTPDFGSSVSADKTCTSSWQRFSASFTLGAPGAVSSFGIIWGSANTALDLQIADLEVFPGNVDLGGLANTLGGHFYPNIRSTTSLTASGGFVDMSGKFGTIQFPAAQSVTQWTVMALVKKTANTFTKDVSLTRLQAFADFAAPYNIDGQPIITTKTSGAQQFGMYTGAWAPSGQGVHVVTHRVTATEESIWVDGVKMHRATATASSFTLRDLWFGRYNTATGDSSWNQVAMWNRALTDDEVVRNTQAMWNRATRSNIVPAKQRLYVPSGDSQTNANGNTYVYQMSGLTYPHLTYNRAVSGYTISDVVAQLPTYKEICDNARKMGRQVVVSLLLGANDLSVEAGASDAIAAAAWADRYLTTLIRPLRGYGAKVIVCTVLPVGTAAGGVFSAKNNARRAVANPIILGWVASGDVDATADFGATGTTYGDDADAEDGAKYPDGLHPVAAAHSGVFAPLMVTALNSIPLI